MKKIFMTITEASRETGLSTFYLRNGCKDDSIQHIMNGNRYLINMPRLLEALDAKEGGDDGADKEL